MGEKLLPCPFCGNPHPAIEGDYAYGYAQRHPDPDNDANHTNWVVSCLKDEGCPIDGVEVVGETQAQAIAAWNTRAPAEQTGWQPIETAPNDGTWFIACGGGLDRPTPMKWCERVGAWECDAVMLEDWDLQAEGYSRPTLWYAIPAPLGTTRAPADLRSALEAETIERCAKACEQLAAGCRAELKDPVNDARTISVLDGYIGACTALAANIRALAPTKGDAS